jgi:antitoxin ParD1/3/4
MSLEVTPEIEEMVQDILGAGHYESESQVINEALNLLKKRDQLRTDIRQGLSEIERGEGVEGDEVFRELEEKAAQLTEAK